MIILYLAKKNNFRPLLSENLKLYFRKNTLEFFNKRFVNTTET